jgi:hypothetical protein
MARIQALTQQHSLERASGPTPERFLSGMSGLSEGVPRMHPLGSSNPVFKAGNLVHLLRIKSFKMPKMSTGVKMPSLRPPRLGFGGMR